MGLIVLPKRGVSHRRWSRVLNRHEELASRLIAWYPLDGTGEDKGPRRQYHMSRFGGVLDADDDFMGGCYEFDATDDYLEVASNLGISKPFTLTCWAMRTSSAEAIQEVFGISNTGANRWHGLTFDAPSSPSFRLNDRGATASLNVASSNSWTLGKWHFFAGIFRSDTSRFIYSDGVLSAEDTTDSGAATVTHTAIGRRARSPNLNFGGRIGECCVFNGALSKDQLDYLFYSETRWRLGNGSRKLFVFGGGAPPSLNLNLPFVADGAVYPPTVATRSVQLVILSSTVTRMAPHPAFAYVALSGFPKQIRCKIEWNWDVTNQLSADLTRKEFRPGRETDDFNVTKGQRGWCSAHLYEEDGTFIVRATVTDELGDVYTADGQITVVSDTRTVRYVSATGSNGGAGTQADPWQTYAFARSQVSGDNWSILLKRGETHDVGSLTDTTSFKNVVIGAYGTGAKPIIRYTVNNQSNSEFFSLTGENCVLRDSVLSWSGTLPSPGNGGVRALRFGTAKTAAVDVEIDGDSGLPIFGRSFQVDADDALILGCHSRQSAGYGIAGPGLRGNVIATRIDNSTEEHGLRLANQDGARDRWAVQACRFQQLAKKQGIRAADVNLMSVWRTAIFGTGLQLGFDDQWCRDFVADECYIENTIADIFGCIQFCPGVERVMIRNSVLVADAQRAIVAHTSGSVTTAKGIKVVDIFHNTIVVKTVSQDLIVLENTSIGGGVGSYPWEDLTFVGNLIADGNGNLLSGKKHIIAKDLLLAEGNVFPAFSDALSFATVDGVGKTWSQWLALAQVGNDFREDVPDTALVSPDYRPDPNTYTTTAGAATVRNSVFEDYDGNARPTSGAWFSGAVDSAGGGLSISLPFIADGGAFDPNVFLEYVISLGLVADGQVFDPSIEFEQAFDLPFIADGGTFAPSFLKTVNLTFIADGGTFSPSFVQGILLSLIAQGGTFAPTFTTSGLPVLLSLTVADFEIEPLPWVAAAAAGNEFRNDGRTILMYRNSGPSACVVNALPRITDSHGHLHSEEAVIPTGGQLVVIGPFPQERWNDQKERVRVNYSSVTGLEVIAVRLVRPR